MLFRVVVLLAGLLILLGGVIMSMGIALLAPVGMWALTAFRRRRHRSVTRAATWTAALTWVGVGMLGLTVALLHSLPAGTLRQVKHAADSASAESYRKPPPAWMERVAPGSTARASRRPATPASLRTPILIWSAGVGLLMMTALIGSIGWAGAMLCGFGIAGRWPNGSAGDQLDEPSARELDGALTS